MTKVVAVVPGCTDGLDGVADALRAGALALLPTETVYGVGVCVGAYSACGETPGPQTGYGRIFTLKPCRGWWLDLRTLIALGGMSCLRFARWHPLFGQAR